MDNTPRLMLAAPGSGSGKTTAACAVLRALKNRGEAVSAFKCGPDYIDPMFHTEVTGVRARNLDLFFFSADTARYLLKRNTPPGALALLEGVMGFYDGVGDSSRASSYELARETGTPVVLVAGCRGKALTLAAELRGLRDFRPESGVRGVLLNGVKPAMFPFYRGLIERETGLRVYGYLPPLPEAALESRHLGLVTAQEVPALQEKLDRLAAQAEETVDLDGLLALARSAPALPAPACLPGTERLEGARVRVAVARDRAFCFYYEDALSLLRALGAELLEFSPLRDRALPEGCAGLLLGGGYPELSVRELSEKEPMREAVRRAVTGGMPCVAECGGFLYLHRTLRGAEGPAYPMAAALPGDAFPAGGLRRFGYVRLTAKQGNLLCRAGESFPAHEFHYWESSCPGGAFAAEKPGGRRWDCAFASPTQYAGFPHFHFCAKPEMAARFLRACAAFEPKKEALHGWN